MACTGEWCGKLPVRSPPEQKKHEREQPKLDPEKETIDRMLEGDRQVARKQRHTAHRIWMRLREEDPEHPIGEPTVQRYVQQRKQELGRNRREVFVPQSCDLGRKARWIGLRRWRSWMGNCASCVVRWYQLETLVLIGAPAVRAENCLCNETST